MANHPQPVEDALEQLARDLGNAPDWTRKAKKAPPIAVEAFERALRFHPLSWQACASAAEERQAAEGEASSADFDELFDAVVRERFAPDAPARSEPPLSRVPLEATATRLFEILALPAELRAFFARHSYAESACFGLVEFAPVNDLATENLDPFHSFVREGFLQIGEASNSDPIVLDLFRCTVGFLDHEEVWGYADAIVPPTRARKNVIDLGIDLGTFYARAAEDWLACGATPKRKTKFPADWHSARRKKRPLAALFAKRARD